MRKVLVSLVVLLVLFGVYVALQWNAAIGTERDVYARTGTLETAQEYLDWAESLKSQPNIHRRLLDKFGPLRAHFNERAALIAAAQAAAEEAAAKAAAAEAAKNALTPEQRRAKWVEEYAVSAAAIAEGVRTSMTALLTHAAAEQRSVTFKVELANDVSDPALKKALDGLDANKLCKWDARKTNAFVDLVATGDPAAEGVKVRLTFLDAKDPLDIDVHEGKGSKKKSLKLAKVRVTLDLRAPNAQPIHVEQEAAMDTADLAGRIKKNPTVADVNSAQTASLGATVCGKVSAMLGLRDP